MSIAPHGVAGGFVADSDVLFRASAQFHDTQAYIYAICAGLAGDLKQTAGMAGDDTTAHNFAKVYEPAAQTVVKGLGNAGEVMATIASRLLGMATNYLNLEDSIARAFTGLIDIAAPLAQMQSECEPNEQYQELPMATGSREVHEIPLIGQFWPQGNPDMLRTAAQIWVKAADLIDDAQVNAMKQQRLVTDNCSCRGGRLRAVRQQAVRRYAVERHVGDLGRAADGEPVGRLPQARPDLRQLQRAHLRHPHHDHRDRGGDRRDHGGRNSADGVHTGRVGRRRGGRRRRGRG